MKVESAAAFALLEWTNRFSQRLMNEAGNVATQRGATIMTRDDIEGAVMRVTDEITRECRDRANSFSEQDDVSIRRAV